MLSSNGSWSPTIDKIGIFLLYSLSFLLGVVLTWVVMNYPVFEGSVTAVKLGEWILLAAGMASLVAATFSALTEWLVINPLENRIQEATAESPLSESSEGSGSAEDVQVETQTKHTVEETLNQLGYDVQLSETQEETDDDSNEV